MTADTRWFAAVVTKDIRCDEYCPHCDKKKFNCTECTDGRAVSHMWGHVNNGRPFFEKGTQVIIARSNAWFSEHDWKGIHISYLYPEFYWVFQPSRTGKKIHVTTAYAKMHLARVRPLQDMTKLGEEALEEFRWQMSR